MLYLGKGRWAVGYLLLPFVLLSALAPAIHAGLLGVRFQTGMAAALALTYIAGLMHSLIIARRIQGKKPSAWFARWYSVCLIGILLPNLVPMPIRWFLWEPFDLPSGSMEPTLQIGDLVFVSKYAYGYSPRVAPFDIGFSSVLSFNGEPARGDIAVFKDPLDNRTDYIKRLIGLPGDRIQVIGGVLHINGQAVTRRKTTNAPEDESRLKPGLKLQRYIEELPNGVSYPILEESDNGFADNTRLFIVPEGHFFAMGDNRDHSRDSRFIGFIPRENMVGRLSLILWNEQKRQLKFLAPGKPEY